MFRIAVLPGDGIGREVTPVATKVLKATADLFQLNLQIESGLIGEDAYEQYGHPLPPATLDLCKNSTAVLLGAVGSPKMDLLPPDLRPERAALLPLRKKLGLFANLRPIKICPELIPSSPLKKEIIEQVDLLTVRELTGGLYFGKKSREIGVDGEEVATDTLEYSSVEIKRILKFAFEAARQRRKKVTSVDKANVLTSSQLWRENAEQMRRDYPDVHLEHMYVDNCAMQLVKNPAQFDVIVTENMFGDILTDQASVLSGSLGMLPSASLGGKTGLYEPAHGSAPELAGQNIANPLATILSTALLFRFSLHHEAAAGAIEQAVAKVLAEGYRTSDLYVPGTTQVGAREMGELVTKFLKMV
ncbi:MAG TPA: 3-isopropylmalate dehydrogenase [Firmicutes bacterium]|nr:3-isopropylmalate dehydrogenase [Bacillota bacterium]HBT17583.1 3-isopropylmalate dehydrogenase [Bacillota bacterium]